MLPTLVIGLREGLEAALIVGIIAAFLRKQGRLDLLRWVFAGVAVAGGLCIAVGVALEVLSRDLPQRQQEGLETVIGGLAVVMVTYMVVWMRRHSRELKGSLETAAATALAGGSSRAGRALVVMAFLAVLREGFETVVFLIAAFNESGNGAPAASGAVLGVLLAIGLGWGIYRGGIRLDLSKFFRATGLVLVLVAAGLVLTALHTAHEAGWLNAGQTPTVDLTWLVRPGSVQASLLTGMLGVQAHPVRIELVGWLAYLIPVGLYVAWPPGWRVAHRGVGAALGVSGVTAGVAAVIGALVVPSAPARSGPAGDKPAAETIASTSRVAKVTITAASGCQITSTKLPAGALTFNVSNTDATAVSEVELVTGERIVGEKEDLPAGFSGSFAVNVPAGTYSLYCPGAANDRTTITVIGAASAAGDDSTAALLAAGTRDYATYVTRQVGYLVQSGTALDNALNGSSLAAAQSAYAKARPFYEKIEPVAESFTVGKDNLDADIDARFGDVPSRQWGGFHRIEKGLFADRSLAGLAPYGDSLVTNLKKLQHLTRGLSYQPYELANGAQELLDEVAASKITGEEERYSHLDLLDVEGNAEGAEQAFADLHRGLSRIDAGLAQSISRQFTALDTLVDSYRTGSNPSGFVYYGTLSKADKRTLAAAVKAVQEPLSRVASKVSRA